MTIGDLVLHCDTGPTTGDFGTLFMPRRFNLTSADNVAANLSQGLDFSVTKYPTPHPAWQCSAGGGGVVSTPGGLNDLTNCVSVDADIGAGMSADAAERGLLTGGGMPCPTGKAHHGGLRVESDHSIRGQCRLADYQQR